MNQKDILSTQLDEELTREGYDKLYVYFIADFLAVILYALLIWGKISHPILLIAWVLIMFIFNHLIRFIIVIVYYLQKSKGKPQNLIFWKNYFNILNTQSGFLWALGGALFIDVPDHTFRLFIFLYLTAVFGTALSKLMVYTISYIGYMTPISILLLWLSISILPQYSIILFLATSLYIFLTVFTVAHAHGVLINSIKLKIYNTNLLQTLKQSEENFRNIIEIAPIGTAIISVEGKYLHVNRIMSEILKYSDEEFRKMSVEDTIYPDDVKSSLDTMHQLLAGEIKIAHSEKRYARKDGSIIWAMVGVSLLRDNEGNPLHFISQIIDVTDRIQIEKKMNELNRQTLATLNELKQVEHEENLLNKLNGLLQLCLTLEETYPGISLIAQEIFPELSGALSIFNKSTQNMETTIQWGKDQLLQSYFLPIDCLAIRGGSVIIVDDPKKFILSANFISLPQGGYIGLPLIVQKDIVGVIHLFAPAGEVTSKHQQDLSITFSNIIKLALANINLRESLLELSLHDPLTGLFNRRYVNETLSRELIRIEREKNKLCVAMLDIDDFKKFNDTSGHDAGDEVLKHIGSLLKKTFRGSDIPCRFGGEEFLVIMPTSDLKSAVNRMNQFRTKIKNDSLLFKGRLLPKIAISIGVSEAPLHGKNVEDIIKAADEALYVAKETGKDKVEAYHGKANHTQNGIVS